MLNSETSVQRNTGGNESVPPATSQVDSVAYIRQTSLELHKLAAGSGLTVLAYMLSMAVLAADEQLENLHAAHRAAMAKEYNSR
jgi:hypothetical protein